MRLQKMEVYNYRTLKDFSISFSNEDFAFNCIIGKNAVGKTNIFKAMKIFFDNEKLSPDDWYNNDYTDPILIKMYFDYLSDKAKDRFETYVENGVLVVEREIIFGGSDLYKGYDFYIPIINNINNVEGAVPKRQAFNQHIKEHPEYNIEPANNATQLEEGMSKLTRILSQSGTFQRRSTQFLGDTNVGYGALGKFCRFIHIPAVQKASDTTGLGLQKLLDQVQREVTQTESRISDIIEKASSNVKDIIESSRGNLDNMERELTGILSNYISGVDIELQFKLSKGLSTPSPTTEARIKEGQYPALINDSAHGTQRAFIIAVLQYLNEWHKVNQMQIHESSILIAIEEPELFQHPSRQRYFSKVFRELTSKKQEFYPTQMVISTHSPLFIDITNISELRRIVLKENGNDPLITQAVQPNISECRQKLVECGVDERKFSSAGLLARLDEVVTPWLSEGFFSQVVILVEGQTDRVALETTAELLSKMDDNYNLIKHDISVLSVESKGKLPIEYSLFAIMYIKTCLLWDGDASNECSERRRENKRLFRLLGVDFNEQEPYDLEGECFLCYRECLETQLKKEFNSIDSIHINYNDFKGTVIERHNIFGVSEKNTLKMRLLIEDAYKEYDFISPSLKSIIDKALAQHKAKL